MAREYQDEEGKWYWIVAENDKFRFLREDDSGVYRLQIIENGTVTYSRYTNSVEGFLLDIIWEKWQEVLDW